LKRGLDCIALDWIEKGKVKDERNMEKALSTHTRKAEKRGGEGEVVNQQQQKANSETFYTSKFHSDEFIF